VHVSRRRLRHTLPSRNEKHAQGNVAVGNKPLLQYGVEEALEAGMNNCAFVTGRGKRAIADHFDISYELEHQISGTSKEKYLEGIRDVIDHGIFTMVRQREMKGLGHAILTGEPLIGDQAFGVLLADDMCINQQGSGVLAQMSELYNQFRCSIVAVMEVPMDQISAYGVIAGDDMGNGLYRVDKMVEKPAPEDAPSNLAVIGRYILTPDIFDIIRETPPGRNGEVQITDALQIQANKGCVLAYKFQGQRFDCGSVPALLKPPTLCLKTCIESYEREPRCARADSLF
jgi:UTP--glucose-1-phosphate uridylyltransferase